MDSATEEDLPENGGVNLLNKVFTKTYEILVQLLGKKLGSPSERILQVLFS